VLLAVADDGPGIAEGEQAGIFERFRRGSAQEAPGSGLAIVKQAVARLGGTVRLTVGLCGKGCAYVISLPAAGTTALRLVEGEAAGEMLADR
jgi:two-component system sensor histidine kinase QseC